MNLSGIHTYTIDSTIDDVTNKYVCIGQAASILWVNRLTIRRWIKQGKLSGQKIGLTTLIPKAEVLAIAKQRGIK